MTKEDQAYFEIFNNCWSLLKPYVSDPKTYKLIMSDIFNMMIKDRGEKYTDEWWKSISEVIDYPEKYKRTKYVEFAADLAIAMCDYWQHDESHKATYYDFMTYISRAFINEWGRLRAEKDKKKTT